MSVDAHEKLFQILDENPIYPLAAYHGLSRGLEYTIRAKRALGHVTGQELAIGMAGFMKEEYGPYARLVLDGWNIHSTLDFGRIVYNLIRAGLMRKQDSDSLEDFLDVYDFDAVFPAQIDWLQSIRTELGLVPIQPESGF
ncbi:MAG: hypothetical protein KJ050_00355 [Candidatus Omnitrophica bacterium]|nr:MAG: hypothetical protein UZ16_OP3001002939 [Candidatus Hinthialibacteria bacterium OLB16]MBE7488573.1 hypothetical protein [bacterium]MBK7495810.1 hypothetical protein [Candidatus Omnitrophota bacterium]MBV6481267.1 hypothetical protein [bacterium]MCC6734055.1 hypothetical protein [Candidatus Omnitrophota bacterium]